MGKLAVLRVHWISSWLMQALHHQNDVAEEAPERFGACEKTKINTVLKFTRCPALALLR